MSHEIKAFLDKLVDEKVANLVTTEVRSNKKFAGLLDYDLESVLEDMAIEQFINSAPQHKAKWR